MRVYVTACCTAIVLTVLVSPGYGDAAQPRWKIFSATDFNVMPESVFHVSDFAKEFTTSLTSSFANLFPQASRRQDAEKTELEKKASPASSTGERELEGDYETGGSDVKKVVENEEWDEGPAKPEKETPTKPKKGTAAKPESESPIGIPFQIPFSLTFGFLTPWWNGPNVCVDRSEVDEPEEEVMDLPGLSFNMESTQCIPSDSNYVCTKTIQTNGLKKTIMVRRQCCHGYVRRQDGQPGCNPVKMETLRDTMKTLEMSRFLQLVDSAALNERILAENLTVFVPSNEAVIDFEDEREDNEISALNSERRQNDWTPIVQGHFTEGFINIDNIENEDLMKTLNSDMKIRINKYEPAHEVLTANCVPITGKNNYATNGMVHLVSAVLPFPKKTIGEIIETEPQYSTFKKLLEEHDLLSDLKKEDKVWTLFAPTNEAFDASDKVFVKQMKDGEGCVQGILKHHIVKGTVCSPAVVSQARIKNLLDNVLKLSKDVEDNLKVEGISINVADKVGTNGVLHGIEKILIPQEARNLLKTFEEEERTDILDLLEEADLLSTFANLENVTFFMPTEEALKKWMNATTEQRSANSELLKQMLLHHIAEPKTPINKFISNKNLKASDGQTISLKLHELFPGIVTGATAQCAYLTSHDNKACGAIVHKINKVLQPSKGNIIEAIKDLENHTIVKKMLEGTEIEKKLKEGGPFTFLAPTDEAFEGMGPEELEEMYKDDSRAEEMLKAHILPEMLCCSDVSHPSPFHRQYVRSYGGTLIPLHRSLHDKLRFGRAKVVQCDIPANNGLVHSVNKIIIPRRTSIFDLWPLV